MINLSQLREMRQSERKKLRIVETERKADTRTTYKHSVRDGDRHRRVETLEREGET